MSRFNVALSCGCWSELVHAKTHKDAARLYIESFNPPLGDTYTVTVFDEENSSGYRFYDAARNGRTIELIEVKHSETLPADCPHVKLLKQLERQIEFAIMHVHEGRKAGVH